MPEAPQLALVDEMEQRLKSELPMDDGDLQPISEAEPRNPIQVLVLSLMTQTS